MLTPKGRKMTDLTGIRKGKLVVLEYLGTEYKASGPCHSWVCQCDCGNTCVKTNVGLKLSYQCPRCSNTERIGVRV